MNIDKKRAIGFGFILIMIMSIVFIINNKDEYFKSVVKMSYPDGCIETFVNSELSSPECTVGRFMLEEQVEKDKMIRGTLLTVNTTIDTTADISEQLKKVYELED